MVAVSQASRAERGGREVSILPCKGRWLAAGQTEGCHAIDRVTPLHHRFAAVPLPLQGRI
ncbi:hypothetical protein D0Z70_07100 [Sphingobium terrigena]|uniref:Uncharacterized protein n=1 Tax=Sphingobium terrigena TaxID=2304063 RepID=A0A418YUK5_9SPHN|nr:hypothetical protein D0Z70_07100 [Sphingobium terrigena]